MSDRLPPLTALRAFDAAARHMSFSRAAAELNVTPAALSFQIKTLEEHLGAPLFRRLNRAVELTAAGRALAPHAADGFESLRAGWRAARRLTATRTLSITAGPAFTAKWLAPRLFRFAAAHPDIELRFTASLRLMDFDRDEIDVAIRFGQSEDADFYSEVLATEWMTPMVAPQHAAGLRAPEDLARLALLHQDDIGFLDPPANWAAWFAAAGLPPPPAGGARFSQADHALDAALAGAGAVLGRGILAEAALREGRLVAPFDLVLDLTAAYRLICPRGAETRADIAAFRAWIRDETESLNALRAGLWPGRVPAAAPR
ncbi:MAG: transcriptional regulator GcvA [Rhodobacteraceae bacterium]|jgi:LysR family glycine cleavage system transcriptional activator|nr:transcriptional regulator GcvA [Paracoccaceae bacterium]